MNRRLGFEPCCYNRRFMNLRRKGKLENFIKTDPELLPKKVTHWEKYWILNFLIPISVTSIVLILVGN